MEIQLLPFPFRSKLSSNQDRYEKLFYILRPTRPIIMTLIQRFLCMLLLPAFVCTSSHVGAQKSKWQILFNGKNLDGWQQLNGKHVWEVSNGMIVGTTVPGEPNGFLCTKKEFGDFILELEVSIDTLMNNSGVQFRSLSYPGYENGRLHGYQMEVDPKPQQWSGAIYEEGGTRGWLFAGDELSAAAKKAFKRDTKSGYQWNKYRIECIGTTIRTWINGVPAAHLIDDKFLRGYIGLQLHANQANDPPGSYKVRFRNIRMQTGILELSPWDNTFVVNLLPNNLSTQEEENGYELLWGGRSDKGWRGPNKSEFPNSAWSYKNGELRVVDVNNTESGSSPYIITENKYGPFELKFDFRISGGSNSGVMYLVNESGDSSSAGRSALEYEIADDSVRGAAGQTVGSLADILEAKKTPIKTDTWYRAMIKVRSNNEVEHWLNGNKVLEYKRGSAEYRDLVSRSKYKGVDNFGMSPVGHILLQNNGSAVSFRSLKIKRN